MTRRASGHARGGRQPSQDNMPLARGHHRPPVTAPKEDRLALLERTLCPTGETVLGLYIYTASVQLLQSLNRHPTYRAIVPHLIGAPAVVSAIPGISQTELGHYLGVERATSGKQVAACLKRGWIRREVSSHDKRRYALYITPKGRRMLHEVAQIIPRHEREHTAILTEEDRQLLKRLLHKLIVGFESQ